METPKRLYKDYGPSKRGLYGFPCEFGGVYFVGSRLRHGPENRGYNIGFGVLGLRV